MKVTDHISRRLVREGVDTVFGYTGGSVADLVDSIFRTRGLRFVQTYSEQAAALAANAYAEIGGGIGVAVASSGPGAINLINGIANAYFDSIPCVFITGNVHTLAERRSPKIRQNAFQETDIVSMVKGVTKYAVHIHDDKAICQELERAILTARSGRQGPVLLDIPYDIQRSDIDADDRPSAPLPTREGEAIDVSRAAELLSACERPLLLAGGGCAGRRKEIESLVRALDIPLVASMRGINALGHDDEHYIGFIGSYGNRNANLAMRYCDLLLVLGSRLDERQIGYRRNEFAPCAKIVHVDIDEEELGRRADCDAAYLCDTGGFISALLRTARRTSYERWRELLARWKARYGDEASPRGGHHANAILRSASKLLPRDAIITADVGQNQIAAAQSVYLDGDKRLLTSAGLGCMGYSLPAAIGAHHAAPSRTVVSISGDGGMMMNLQELQTVKRDAIPLKMIILNNKCLGLIRNLQDKMFDGVHCASVDGYQAADIQKIASAFDLRYARIDGGELSERHERMLLDGSPAVIEVALPQDEDTYPDAGSGIHDQRPALERSELDEIERQFSCITS